jgi:hypothetical protein
MKQLLLYLRIVALKTISNIAASYFILIEAVLSS